MYKRIEMYKKKNSESTPQQNFKKNLSASPIPELEYFKIAKYQVLNTLS